MPSGWSRLDHHWWNMPIPSYADAVRYVRRQPRINTSTLADGLGIRWSLALDYLQRMESAGVVGAIDDHGWWPVSRPKGPPIARKPAAPPAPAAATAPLNGPAPAPQKAPESPAAAASLGQAGDQDQQDLLEKLRDAARVLMAEREKMPAGC